MSSDDAIYSPYLKQGNAKDAFVKKVDKTASVVDKSVAHNELLKSSATPEYLYDRNRVVHLESKGLLHDYKADIVLDNSIDATLMSDGMKLQLASEMMEKESSLIKNSENVHSLTGDVAEGVKGKVKGMPKEALKGAALGAIKGTQALVGNTYGEESMEAMEVLSGKKLKEGVETVKGVKAKVDAPFAAVGKVARAPRRVGEAYASMLEHSATRQLKRADKRIKNYAGNKEALAKAHRQLGRAQEKLNRAKMIKAKKRPFAWLFDGRGKEALLKLCAMAAPLFVVFLLVIFIFMAGAGGGASDRKDGGSLSGNALIAYQVLSEAGYSNVACAAILGNFQAEGGMNPHRAQDDYDEYTSDGIFVRHWAFDLRQYSDRTNVPEYPDWLIDNDHFGYGIAQWTSPGRSRGLIEFAKSMGKSSGDFEAQIKFVVEECKSGSYPDVSPNSYFATKETDLEAATRLWCNKYEIGNWSDNRYNFAQDFLNKINSGDINNSEAAKRAYECIGVKYDWGGAGEEGRGYDCSGLVSYCLTGQHIHRWNTGGLLSELERLTSRDELKAGDVLCNSHHCAMYVGNNKVIHAPQKGETVCEVDLDEFLRYNGSFEYLRYNG